MGVSCLDFRAMKLFYTDVLGMTVSDVGHIPVRGGIDIAFLTTDPDDHHQFVLASGRIDQTIDRSPVRGGRFGAAVFQIAFRLDSLSSLRRIVERLRAAGVESFSPINHGNAWSVYTCDIEGNPLELFVDSPWYVAQPCGFDLDLTMSDEEIQAATEKYCQEQPDVTSYAEWSDQMASTIVANQANL
jgi:catechol-2,3-dioxygenase